MLLLPLLLLASPGGASNGAHHGRSTRPAPTRAAHESSLRVVGTPSWAVPLVVAANWQAPVTTTTTTTLPAAPPPAPAPVVRAAAVPVTTTTTVPPTTTAPPTTTTTAAPAHSETGQASWYSAPTGTCASPNLAFGTVVTVTNLANGATTTCTIEDRQSTSTGRILDMSEGSFAQIADPSQGVIEVRLTW